MAVFMPFMRRVLAIPAGQVLYRRRPGMIETVFADTKFNRKIDRFLRRGVRGLGGEVAAGLLICFLGR
jgi:hypothetical protein